MRCGACAGEGIVNLHQVPADVVAAAEASGDYFATMIAWLLAHLENDAAVCACCGDGVEEHHGVPGEHDHRDYGPAGPYAYNGGVPECI